MAELILALDVPDQVTAFRMLDRLSAVRWVKVGSILMTREGPDLVDRLNERGLSVFLDLKWHDIPNTVRGAVEAARGLGVRMVTVHALGGARMMAAAAEAAGPALAVVAVTVLTSHSPGSYGDALARPDPPPDLAGEAVRQARNARDAGLNGVVASAHEVKAIRAALGPEPLLVVPGLRLAGDPAGDQARVATPAQAVADGATHLVVGRSVLLADDPGAAWDAIRADAGDQAPLPGGVP